MKRLISSDASEILAMDGGTLKQSIKASEGRVILSENVVGATPMIGDITNAEIARAFGADLILLNGIDMIHPEIIGLSDVENQSFVETLHHLVGRPIGVNLEPVADNADMLAERLVIASGRQATAETFAVAEKLGVDFVCLTGNPGTGVSNVGIEEAIRLGKTNFSGLIIAGKMHGAGVDEAVVDLDAVTRFIQAGADIILVPAVGTVPGVDEADLKAVVHLAHQKDVLVMSAIGTSQESAHPETIRELAIRNKICGVDIQHIGDAGYGGLAPVENIFTLSQAIRGNRHTISMMARSIHR